MPFDEKNPFFRVFRQRVAELGGMFNAHVHLDRYGTLDPEYMETAGHRILDSSHISLHRKHSLISVLHEGPAFRENSLRERVNEALDTMVECNTFRADTMVDVTDDCVGLSAMEVFADIREKRADEIDLRIASYSPFGFRDAEPRAWSLFREGTEMADFIGALPEADDTDEYPDHIGFMEHCRRTLELGQELNKAVHVHTDQRNEPTESGTERLVEAVRRYGAPRSSDGEPMVWAVHMISPSTYDEPRFRRLVDGLVENNIGVICCPSAAVGMRQLRPVLTPTYNSIPRVLELLEAGVHVRLASDNIADICSPSTTADLADEVFMLSAAVRFYNIDILARLASGQKLADTERQAVAQHLERNEREIEKVLRDTGQIDQRREA